MDIKNLAGLVSLKTGKFADVKNPGSIGFKNDEAPTQAKDHFSSILAAEDSRNLPLSTEDSKTLLTAGDLTQQIALTVPVAVLYSAPSPLVLAGNASIASGDLVRGGGALNSVMMGRVGDVISTDLAGDIPPTALNKPDDQPFPLPAAALENRLAPLPHADLGFSSATVLMTEPSTLIKFEEAKPQLPMVSLAAIQVGDLPSGKKPDVNALTSLKGELLKGTSDVSNNLIKRLTVNLFSHEMIISTPSPQQSDGLVLAPKNISKPTVKSLNFEDEKIKFSLSSAKSTLDEAGRKNEALLDVLAQGEGRTKPVADESEIKPVNYTFQRETVAESILLKQSSSPSQAQVTESLQAAEKNNYWGVNGPQNIALTLGGVGDETVAVKILVSGLDTQVDIRTDDQSLRQMIEGSVQEMKEKLSTEGLTLSGLSVGATSQEQGRGHGAGHAMGRESQRREAPEDLSPQKSTQITGFKNTVSNTESRPTSVGGHKLSVFV